MAATGIIETQWRDFVPIEDCVRTALLRLSMELGAAPDTATLAARAGLSQASVRAVLNHLPRPSLHRIPVSASAWGL